METMMGNFLFAQRVCVCARKRQGCLGQDGFSFLLLIDLCFQDIGDILLAARGNTNAGSDCEKGEEHAENKKSGELSVIESTRGAREAARTRSSAGAAHLSASGKVGIVAAKRTAFKRAIVTRTVGLALLGIAGTVRGTLGLSGFRGAAQRAVCIEESGLFALLEE